MNSDTERPGASAPFKVISSALIAASPLLLLAIGMVLTWWIPAVFAWLAVGIYYGGVRTQRGTWVTGTILLTLALAIWTYVVFRDHEAAVLGVYFFYPLLTIVAAGAAIIDTMGRSRNDVKKWRH